MTDKEFVLSKYPDAQFVQVIMKHRNHEIYGYCYEINGKREAYSSLCDTEQQAWQNAKERIQNEMK